MFVLDANVVSETMRLAPSAAVMDWFDTLPIASLFLPSVVVAELYAGVDLLETGKRRTALEATIRGFVAAVGSSNIIDFGLTEAACYARILARRQRQGRRIMIADAQVAACAASRQLPVVTRNVRHFEHCGIEVINPWDARP